MAILTVSTINTQFGQVNFPYQPDLTPELLAAQPINALLPLVLADGGSFVDLSAGAGWPSLIANDLVGAGGRVQAFAADETDSTLLQDNLRRLAPEVEILDQDQLRDILDGDLANTVLRVADQEGITLAVNFAPALHRHSPLILWELGHLDPMQASAAFGALSLLRSLGYQLRVHTAQVADCPPEEVAQLCAELPAGQALQLLLVPKNPARDLSLTRYEAKVFSQFGEDGVIAELIRRVGAPGRYFVEFGTEDGQETNCRALAEFHGWSGLFMEGDPEKAQQLNDLWSSHDAVRTRQALVYPDNFNALLDEENVPVEPDIVSIDVDSFEYFLWGALERRPRIMVLEYNGQLPLDRAVSVPYDKDFAWNGQDDYNGSSLGALEKQAAEKGYRLVHTTSNGVNAFFVREDLWNEELFCADAQVPRHQANYWPHYPHHPKDEADRPFVDLDQPGQPLVQVPRAV